MPNGKPGDHPVNDICNHGLAVFSPRADALIRELDRLAGRDRMWGFFDWFAPPPPADFERRLEALVKQWRAEADRGGRESP
jgi:hypothetical protein